MSEWINEWRREHDAKQEEQRHKDQLRLQEDRIIRAKLPSFWRAFVQCVQEDANALREAFPTEGEYGCFLDLSQASLKYSINVTKEADPRRSIEIRLNSDARVIQLIEVKQFDAAGRPQPRQVDAQVRLIGDEQLSLHTHDRSFAGPAALSQYVFAFVCGKTD